jgi:hypothetical protein
MIRNLEFYLSERNLVKELSLAHLRETRVGIDAQAYIDQLLNAADTKEPLVTALGGAPLALGARIEENLRALEGHRIKPIFVFPGVEPCRKDKPYSLHTEEQNLRSIRRHQAWENFEKGKTDMATMGFASSSSTGYKDVLRLVHRLFKHRRVEFMTAPYLAAAQVSVAPELTRDKCSWLSKARLLGATPQAIHSRHIRVNRSVTL